MLYKQQYLSCWQGFDQALLNLRAKAANTFRSSSKESAPISVFRLIFNYQNIHYELLTFLFPGKKKKQLASSLIFRSLFSGPCVSILSWAELS